MSVREIFLKASNRGNSNVLTVQKSILVFPEANPSFCFYLTLILPHFLILSHSLCLPTDRGRASGQGAVAGGAAEGGVVLEEHHQERGWGDAGDPRPPHSLRLLQEERHPAVSTSIFLPLVYTIICFSFRMTDNTILLCVWWAPPALCMMSSKFLKASLTPLLQRTAPAYATILTLLRSLPLEAVRTFPPPPTRQTPISHKNYALPYHLLANSELPSIL